MTTQGSSRLVPRWLSVIVIAVLGVFIVSLILFALSQTPTTGPPKGYSSFLQDVQAGRVTKVVQEGDVLTVSEGADRFQVVVPSVLTEVYSDMKTAAETGGVSLSPEVFVATKAPDTSWLGLAITALLPLVVVIVVFGFVVYILARRGGGHPDAASRLRALDTAWKAGLVTDDERDRKRTQIIEGI